MSDDAVFYAKWRHAAAAIPHASGFSRNSDASCRRSATPDFWGTSRSDAFHDWITLRFRSSTAIFSAKVRQALPPGFPLLSCCSDSIGQSAPASGISYKRISSATATW